MNNSSVKTAIFMADGCEEVEALSTYDILYRAGIECIKVSVSDNLSITSSHKVTILCDTTISQLNFDDIDMIILPGGVPGTPNLKACSVLCDNIKKYIAEGKKVAAICAAPTILAELGLLKNKKATCYPSCKNTLTDNGALYVEDKVVVSDNIITSRGVGTALYFGLAIVEMYFGLKEAEHLKESIVL